MRLRSALTIGPRPVLSRSDMASWPASAWLQPFHLMLKVSAGFVYDPWPIVITLALNSSGLRKVHRVGSIESRRYCLANRFCKARRFWALLIQKPAMVSRRSLQRSKRPQASSSRRQFDLSVLPTASRRFNKRSLPSSTSPISFLEAAWLVWEPADLKSDWAQIVPILSSTVCANVVGRSHGQTLSV